MRGVDNWTIFMDVICVSSLITETKIDSSFPETQVVIDGVTTPYRIDRDCNRVCLLLYIKENISSNLLTNLSISKKLEGIFAELNFYRKNALPHNLFI